MKTYVIISSSFAGDRPAKNVQSAVVRVFLAAVAVALFVAVGTPLFARSQGNLNPRVHPPGSNPYGQSYREWVAVYWQWLMSFPADQSPSFEQGDVVYGAQKQSGPVWILESGNSGVFVREAYVPLGKAILFSVTGAYADTLQLPGASEEDLLQNVTAPFNELTVLPYAEVDGVPLQNLDQYLVTSPLFDVTVADPGLFGQPGGAGQAVAKGWFFILAPLSAGHHTLRVTYHVVEIPGIDGDTSYNITVE